MYRIRKLFKFEAAHILNNAYTKECSENIHGHSFKVGVFIITQHLNRHDMVIDFGELKDIMQEVIDKYDHSMIVSRTFSDDDFHTALRGQNRKINWVNGNPTAEKLAKELYDEINERIKRLIKDLILEKVRVHETESGYAEYIGE